MIHAMIHGWIIEWRKSKGKMKMKDIMKKKMVMMVIIPMMMIMMMTKITMIKITKMEDQIATYKMAMNKKRRMVMMMIIP